VSESSMWGVLHRDVFLESQHWKAERLPVNPMKPGLPDVLWAHRMASRDDSGLIELKELDAWPKRDTTIVHIDHFTKEQRMFAREWSRFGRIHFLLKVKRDWLLFDGAVAAECVGVCTREGLWQNVIKGWSPLDPHMLRLALLGLHPR
jgi:hypothetical protein